MLSTDQLQNVRNQEFLPESGLIENVSFDLDIPTDFFQMRTGTGELNEIL